jgi:hypothetical protein
MPISSSDCSLALSSALTAGNPSGKLFDAAATICRSVAAAEMKTIIA